MPQTFHFLTMSKYQLNSSYTNDFERQVRVQSLKLSWNKKSKYIYDGKKKSKYIYASILCH